MQTASEEVFLQAQEETEAGALRCSTKGLTLCLEFNCENTAEAIASLVQSHTTAFSSNTILTFPRKTNTSGTKTHREGGFE